MDLFPRPRQITNRPTGVAFGRVFSDPTSLPGSRRRFATSKSIHRSVSRLMIATGSLPPHSETPHAPRGLSILLTVIALYGVGFGALLIATGLFVGLYIVVVGAAHVLVGVGFAASATGIRKGNGASYTLGYVLAVAVTVISLIAVGSSALDRDLAAVIVWGVISVFFILVAFVTRTATRSLPPPQSSVPVSRT